MAREIIGLLYKEFLLEWKQKYAFNGLVLYVLAVVTVVALSLMNPGSKAWNAIFWVVMVFVAINAIARSFVGERREHLLYLYTVASPRAIILSKMLYGTTVLVAVGFITAIAYAILGKQNIGNVGLFALAIVVGAAALAANLTLVSAIAARAENKSTLMAVLGFPVIIPVHLTLSKVTHKAIEGFPIYESYNSLGFLLGLTAMLVVISAVLFPALWRE